MIHNQFDKCHYNVNEGINELFIQMTESIVEQSLIEETMLQLRQDIYQEVSKDPMFDAKDTNTLRLSRSQYKVKIEEEIAKRYNEQKHHWDEYFRCISEGELDQYMKDEEAKERERLHNAGVSLTRGQVKKAVESRKEEAKREWLLKFDKRRRVGIYVSYDMGWQKRSSGRSYSSESGHGIAFGCLSGTVIAYHVAIKSICNRLVSYHFLSRAYLRVIGRDLFLRGTSA